MSTKAQERKAMHGTGKVYWRRLGSEIRRDKWLYLLLLPGLIYFIIFSDDMILYYTDASSFFKLAPS